MAVYITQGELGAGKGIFGAYIMSRYYNDGDVNIRCAANYPFYTEHLGPASSKFITVLPCNVRSDDLISLGMGSPDSYKDKFGVLILDECASFLNSRNYRDSDRYRLIQWLIHARKCHWDVYLLVQHPDMIDSQVRDALIQHLVVIKRLDHIRIPFISTVMELLRPKEFGINRAKKSIFPHYVQARFYGKKKLPYEKPHNEFTFRARDYYSCYDTDYKFTDGNELIGENFFDMRASYSLISGKTIMNAESSVKKPESVSSDKPAKKKGCLSLLIKSAVLSALGYVCFLIWSSVFGSGDKPESVSAADNSVSSVNTVSVPQPALPVLSARWRLTGYLTLSDSERYFILTDSAGNVRYHSSEQEYNGRFTRLLIGNELVTFYSGSSGTTQGGAPDMSEMINSGVTSSATSFFK